MIKQFKVWLINPQKNVLVKKMLVTTSKYPTHRCQISQTNNPKPANHRGVEVASVPNVSYHVHMSCLLADRQIHLNTSQRPIVKYLWFGGNVCK